MKRTVSPEGPDCGLCNSVLLTDLSRLLCVIDVIFKFIAGFLGFLIGYFQWMQLRRAPHLLGGTWRDPSSLADFTRFRTPFFLSL